MDEPSLKFNVISQWTASSGILRVQAVELAAQPQISGTYAIRICFLDSPSGEPVLCVTMNSAATSEFTELLGHAIQSILMLSRSR